MIFFYILIILGNYGSPVLSLQADKYLTDENSKKPEILTSYPDELLASISEALIIPCISRGNPGPELFWYYKDSPVHSTFGQSRIFTESSHFNVANETFSFSLLNLKPTSHIDDGSYISCRAENVLDKNVWMKRTQIKIVNNDENPKHESYFQWRSSFKVDYDYGLGERAVVQCQIDDDKYSFSKEVQVFWLKDGKLLRLPVSSLSINTPSGDIQKDQMTQLMISSLKISDQGTYQCILINDTFIRISQPMHLRIIDPPGKPIHLRATILNIVPTILDIKVEFSCDKAMNFRAIARSMNPKYPWLYHEYYGHETESIDLLNKHEVIIPNIRPDIQYEIQVISMNKFKHQNPSNTLLLNPINYDLSLDVPRLIYVAMANRKMLLIQWNNPVFVNDDTLKIYGEIRHPNHETWKEFPIQHKNYATISHLRPEVFYEIRLAAKNTHGNIEYTNSYGFYTKKNSSSKLPNFHIQQMDDEYMVIVWPNITEIIRSDDYKVQISSGINAEQTRNFPANISRIIYRKIDESKSLTAKLIDLKNGRISEESRIDIPKDYQQFESKLEIKTIDKNCVTIKYDMKALLGLFTDIQLNSTSAILAVIYEINPSFDVNKDFMMDWSTISQYGNMLDEIKLNNMSSSSFHGLQRKFLLCGLYDMVKYVVKLGLNSTDCTAGYASLPFQLPSKYNNGIGAEYEFRVLAMNKIGSSEEISETMRIPDQPPSDAPADWMYAKTSSSRGILRWLPPPLKYRKGKILAYQLRSIKKTDELSEIENMIQVNGTSYEFDRPDIPLTFFIRAVNSAGPGPWTDKILIEPPLSKPENVIAFWIGLSAVRITWNVKNIEKYLHFVVWYASKDFPDKALWNKATTNGPVTQFTLTHVDPSINYYIRVSGFDFRQEESTWSSSVLVEKPSSTSNKQITLDQNRNQPQEMLTGLSALGHGNSGINKFQCISQSSDTIILTWQTAGGIIIPKGSIEIKVVGLKEYVNEEGRYVKEDTGVFVNSGNNLNLIELTHNSYQTIINHLLPNTKYDITLAVTGTYVNYNTECTTHWSKPDSVKSPKRVEFVKMSEGQVSMNLFRTSDKNGPIVNYYLIVTPDLIQNKHRSYETMSPDDYDFNQLSFNVNLPSDQGPYVALAMKSSAIFPNLHDSVYNFRLGKIATMKSNQMYQNDGYQRSGNSISAKNKHLKVTGYYRAAVRACTEVPGQRLCTNSPWSERFLPKSEPHQSRPMSDGILTQEYNSNKEQDQPSTSSLGQLDSMKKTSLILLSILGTLGMIAILVIIIGCFVRHKTRKRVSQLSQNGFLISNQTPSNSTPYITQNQWFGKDLSNSFMKSMTPVQSPNLHDFSGISMSSNPSLKCSMNNNSGQNYGYPRSVNHSNGEVLKGSRSITQFSEVFGNPGSDSGTGTVFHMNAIGSTMGLGLVEEASYSLDSPSMNRGYDVGRRSAYTLTVSQITDFILDCKLNCQVKNQKFVYNLTDNKTANSSTNLILDMENEFKLIENDSNLFFHKEATVSASAVAFNLAKNRYPNLSTVFDHTRVILRNLNMMPNYIPGSDYINANHVDGYKRTNAFIAAETPLPNCIGDFWTMIYQQNVRLIVMLSDLSDVNNYQQGEVEDTSYLPQRGSINHRGILISVVERNQYADYSLNRICLEYNNDVREIWQAHYKTWPMGDLPKIEGSLLNFMRRIDACLNTTTTTKFSPNMKCTFESLIHDGTILVHCLNGICRTGTFIAICNGIFQVNLEKSLDVFGIVKRLRMSRCNLVSCLEQYQMIYRIIGEYLIDGITEIPTKDFVPTFSNLSMKRIANVMDINCLLASSSKTSTSALYSEMANVETGIQMEFKKCRILTQNLIGEFYQIFSSPLLKRSIDEKNRLVNLLPYNFNRVILESIRGIEHSDYINASHVDSYKKKDAFIVTQAPMANTVDDFWRMIWQYKSNIIVMLCQVCEGEKIKSTCYWPKGTLNKHHYFVVESISEYTMTDYVLREFKMSDVRSGETRTIRQFQFLTWPDDSIVSLNGTALCDLIFQISKTTEQFGVDGPITVHCSTGGSRSGIYLCLSNILERLSIDGFIDCYQTVKMLHNQRAQLVNTEEQYHLCYQIISSYLLANQRANTYC